MRLGVKAEVTEGKPSILFSAIRNGNLDLVKTLIEGGVNPFKADIYDRNAFDIAALEEQKAILIYLAEKYGYDSDKIEKIKQNRYFYGHRKKGIILWIYPFETTSGKESGTIKELTGSVAAPSESQILHQMDTLSEDAKIVTDRNGNYYFQYQTPITLKPDHPFIGGYLLNLTQYKNTLISADNLKSLSLQIKADGTKFSEYLKDDNYLMIHSPEVQNKSNELIRNASTYLDYFIAIDQFVHEHLIYDDPPKRPNTTAEIISFTQGRCGEYAQLRLSLLRAAGIPARYINGTSPYDFGPVQLEKEEPLNDHKWLEAYVPGLGWVVLPSTHRLSKKAQFQENYKANYYIRRRGDETDLAQRQILNKVKRSGNYHGHGIFLELESAIFPLFRSVLKKILTYDKSVSPDIFSEMDILPKEAKILVNWLLTSRPESEIYKKAADNFNRLILETPQFKKETFLYVSPAVMNQRIVHSKNHKISSLHTKIFQKGGNALLERSISTNYPLAADEKSAQYRTRIMDPTIEKVPLDIMQGLQQKPDTYLKQLVNFLVQGADNDFIKVKRLHDWLTLNIGYDEDKDTKIVDKTRRSVEGIQNYLWGIFKIV